MSVTPVDANASPAAPPDLGKLASAGPFGPLPERAALIAIGGAPARVLAATPTALAPFDSPDPSALDALLLRGDGPSARRLRHLAVSLPLDAPPRLEAFRFFIGRRTFAVTSRCARIAADGGETVLILALPTPLDAGAMNVTETPLPASPPSPPAAPKRDAPPVAAGSRFLWRLDADGRFEAPDPTLAVALGAHAPQPGETFAGLARRVGLAEDSPFAAALAGHATFAALPVDWPLAGGGRRALSFSAAPLFDRSRAFAGLRGFGVVGDRIDVLPEAPTAAEPEVGPVAPASPLPALSETEAPAAIPLIDAAAPAATEDEQTEADERVESALESTIAPAPSQAGVIAALESPAAEIAAPVTEAQVEAFDPAAPQTSESTPAVAAPLAPTPPAIDEAERLEAPEIAALEATPEAGLEAARRIAPTGAETEATALAEAPTVEPIAAGEDDTRVGSAGGKPTSVLLAPPAPATTEEAASVASREGSPAGGTPAPMPARSAEIVVLRHEPTPAAAPNVVPIRPGVLDALTRRDDGQSESVELTTSEREAFREIARALVGRAPAGQTEKPAALTAFDGEAANPVAAARDVIDLAFGAQPPSAVAAPEAPRPAGAAEPDAAQCNAAAALDRLPVGALVTREAKALYLNRTLLELLGYRDLQAFEAADELNAMFRGRDPETLAPTDDSGALPLVKADGEIIAVDGHAQPILWDGAPATLIALRRSLEAEFQTRLRAAERDARARSGAASDLQQILDRSTDGAVMLDATARILSVSRPGEALFGYDQKEIAGESLLMLLAPQSHPETTRRLDALSRADESDSPGKPFEIVGRDRGGRTRPLMLTLGRIGPLEAPHYCALFRDLAPEREAERRLGAARDAAQAASLSKTDFLALVSHEIRTPLHAILGFAEVMIEERFGPIGNERYKDYLKDIHASGKHVMSLADDLLDLTKVESGKLELQFEPVDANALIRECVALMQPQAARERIIMRTSLLDRLPKVIADERSLKQIMLNLMSNAVKFNEPGGQVIVSTALDGASQAVIRVRDTGVGMNENEIAIALTPFGRVGSSRRAGGTGLGLPLTKALVEANKAEFTIKSRREQGTLIEIAFPRVEAAQ